MSNDKSQYNGQNGNGYQPLPCTPTPPPGPEDDTPTLADAQPGGRVRVGHANIEPLGHLSDRVEFALRVAGFDLDEAAFAAEAVVAHQKSWEKEFAAQPSPGGQDALSAMLPDDARLVGVIADNIERGKLDHPGFYRNTQLAEALRRVLDAAQSGQRFPCSQWDDNDLLAALRGVENYLYYGDSNPIHTATVRAAINALAARQPVGEPVFRDRPTHNVYRGSCGLLPCLCWADEDHILGDEVKRYAAPPAQAVDLERARDEGHDGAIRYVLGYLNGVGDCGSTAYDEILNACGRERIIRSAVEDDELEFTGLGRWVEIYGTADDRALIDSQAVGNG